MRKLSLVLVGVCSWEPERTYTLDGRVADEILLADQIVKCRNNPLELTDIRQNAANVGLDRMNKGLGG